MPAGLKNLGNTCYVNSFLQVKTQIWNNFTLRYDKCSHSTYQNVSDGFIIRAFNSFQIWFHNVPFRQALYDWDPEEDEAERENDTLLMAERQV